MTLFDAEPAGARASSPEPAASSGRLPASPSGRVRALLAYDGSDFHGFAVQRDQRTVAGELGAALGRVLGTVPELTVAGRTDAGVHAWGQVVSFDADPDVDLDRLRGALNGMLAPEVVVRELASAPADFDARHSAAWRCYRYTIVNGAEPDPFRARYAWWVPVPLDRSLLRLAADPFVGEHDFAALCRRGPEGSTTERRVMVSRWHDDGDVLVYEVRATAFCWQMVRSIVGLLAEVGSGRRTPGDVLRILRSRDRAQAGRLAPPHGLCLWEVGYPDSPAAEPVTGACA